MMLNLSPMAHLTLEDYTPAGVKASVKLGFQPPQGCRMSDRFCVPAAMSSLLGISTGQAASMIYHVRATMKKNPKVQVGGPESLVPVSYADCRAKNTRGVGGVYSWEFDMALAALGLKSEYWNTLTRKFEAVAAQAEQRMLSAMGDYKKPTIAKFLQIVAASGWFNKPIYFTINGHALVTYQGYVSDNRHGTLPGAKFPGRRSRVCGFRFIMPA